MTGRRHVLPACASAAEEAVLLRLTERGDALPERVRLRPVLAGELSRVRLEGGPTRLGGVSDHLRLRGRRLLDRRRDALSQCVLVRALGAGLAVRAVLRIERRRSLARSALHDRSALSTVLSASSSAWRRTDQTRWTCSGSCRTSRRSSRPSRSSTASTSGSPHSTGRVSRHLQAPRPAPQAPQPRPRARSSFSYSWPPHSKSCCLPRTSHRGCNRSVSAW